MLPPNVTHAQVDMDAHAADLGLTLSSRSGLSEADIDDRAARFESIRVEARPPS